MWWHQSGMKRGSTRCIKVHVREQLKQRLQRFHLYVEEHITKLLLRRYEATDVKMLQLQF